MDQTEFWALVDETRDATRDDFDAQENLLIEKLSQRPLADIVAWQGRFDELMDRAYRGDLWDVAYIIGCGCGDDGFIDFRAWLIGRGRKMYEQVLADPENLADLIAPGQEANTRSGLWYVALGAYERKTGDKDYKQLPPRQLSELKGKTLAEEDISGRFPRIAARFWKRCLEL